MPFPASLSSGSKSPLRCYSIGVFTNRGTEAIVQTIQHVWEGQGPEPGLSTPCCCPKDPATVTGMKLLSNEFSELMQGQSLKTEKILGSVVLSQGVGDCQNWKGPQKASR